MSTYGVKAFAAAVKNVDFMRVSEFVVITIRTMQSIPTALNAVGIFLSNR